MQPRFHSISQMTVRILQGDCRDVLKTLPDEGVHCVVTSPPYYGLRDYGVAGQIGLEASPEDFLDAMVEVFAEVRRVLRADGTAWVNMGDGYASAGGPGWQGKNGQRADRRFTAVRDTVPMREISRRPPKGLKPKDLMGMPWRLAFALQADGWWLRQDIVWHKPNPMPESVRDRCTKSHEYIFLLTKSERYYFDADAIAERAASAWNPDDCKAPDGWATHAGSHGTIHREGREKGRSGNKARKPASSRGVPEQTGKNQAGSVPWEGATRNKRSVWTVTTKPFKEAHFATFPPALIEPCILASTSARGCCSKCGAPWKRQLEVSYVKNRPSAGSDPRSRNEDRLSDARAVYESQGWQGNNLLRDAKTLGWEPGCACDAGVVPCSVLDPFGGAGTTGLVADRHGRDAILIELNESYADMAQRRIAGDAPLFAEVQ